MPAANVAGKRTVFKEGVIKNRFSVRHVQNTRLESHDAASWNLEFKMCLRGARVHAHHGAAGVAKHLDNLAGILSRALNNGLLYRLNFMSLRIFLKENSGATHLELKALTPHCFHKNREMKNATSGNFNSRFIGKLLNVHGNVIFGLAHQALFKLTAANYITLASYQRRA